MLVDATTPSTLFAVAAGVGVLHTLAGPDPYLPLVAVGRTRNWGLRRLAVAAVGFGLVHCATSVLLVVGLLSWWQSVASEALVDSMAVVSAWLMVGTGLALMAATWRRHRRASSASSQGGPSRDGRIGLVLLSLVFMIGPCEWLIPCALGAGAQFGLWGALGVCAVYTTCTVSTMVAAVAVTHAGLQRVMPSRVAGSAAGGLVAAVTCAGCGTLMLLGY